MGDYTGAVLRYTDHIGRGDRMTVERARELLRAGKRLRIKTGTAAEDPIVVLSLDGGMVMCESVAGWSAGVIEPACAVDSEYLRTYFDPAREVEVLDAGDSGWRGGE